MRKVELSAVTAPILGSSKIQDFLGCSRSHGSSDVKHWSADIAVSGSRPLVAEIRDSPLHRLSLSTSYRPGITEILLKRLETVSLLPIHFWLSIVLSWLLVIDH